MNIPATLKHSFLLCLFAAAVPLRAIPAPMQVTASTPARVWTEGYGTGNGRLGILSFGVFPKETVVLNEGSIFAKKNFQVREANSAVQTSYSVRISFPPATLRGIISRGGVFRWNSRGFLHLPPISVRWICGGARQPPAPNSARGN